jgi:hypothetical protein
MASVEDLDLDIGNYSIKDLETFFHLMPGKPYSADDIEEKEAELREILLKSGHVSRKLRRELIEFLTTAKNWLIFVKCEKKSPPTTLPRNVRIDATEYAEPALPARDGMLIDRSKPNGTVDGKTYFAGMVNPLATQTLTKCLTIDTRFRDNYYNTSSSDFQVQLPVKFSKVVSMQLASMEFPVAFYGITKKQGNNFLYIELSYEDTDGNSFIEDKSIILPDGNYNAVDFVSILNSNLSPKTGDGTLVYPDDMFSYLMFYLDVTATGSGTGKVTLHTTGSRSEWIKNIKLDFTRDVNGSVDNVDISTKIGWNLGFIHKVYDGATSYVSDTILEPATVRYVYLVVEDFNNSVNNHFYTAFKNSILNPNILARISLKGSYFTILMENDYHIVTEPRQYFGPVDIQRLRIRMLDEYGRPLEMNNANYSFCLNFKVMYDF